MKRKKKIASNTHVHDKFMNGIDVDTLCWTKIHPGYIYTGRLHTFCTLFLFFFFTWSSNKKLFLKTVTIAKANKPVKVQGTTLQNIKFGEHTTSIQANQFLQNIACTTECTLKRLNKGMVAWENRWTNRVSNSRFAKCPAQQAAAILKQKRFKMYRLYWKWWLL